MLFIVLMVIQKLVKLNRNQLIFLLVGIHLILVAQSTLLVVQNIYFAFGLHLAQVLQMPIMMLVLLIKDVLTMKLMVRGQLV